MVATVVTLARAEHFPSFAQRFLGSLHHVVLAPGGPCVDQDAGAEQLVGEIVRRVLGCVRDAGAGQAAAARAIERKGQVHPRSCRFAARRAVDAPRGHRRAVSREVGEVPRHGGAVFGSSGSSTQAVASPPPILPGIDAAERRSCRRCRRACANPCSFDRCTCSPDCRRSRRSPTRRHVVDHDTIVRAEVDGVRQSHLGGGERGLEPRTCRRWTSVQRSRLRHGFDQYVGVVD